MLPPRSETVVPLFAKRLNIDRSCICLVEPLPAKPKQQYMCARTLNTLDRQTVCGRILNPTNQPLRIHKGMPVGTLNEVERDSIAVFDDSSTSTLVRQPPASEKPKYTFQELGVKIGKENLTLEQKESLGKLIEKNSDVFALSLADFKRTNLVQLEIDTGDAPPQRQRAYRHPPAVRAEIERQTQEMLENDIIEPSNSLWNSPCILVKKKAAGESRLCIDYRKLNSVTKAMSFPLPTLPEVFKTMSEAQPCFLSTTDLRSAYYQMEVAPQSREKTTFSTHEGSWAFRVVPFGLCNSPI